MFDRMTVASRTQWRNDAPPVGQVVEVWFLSEIILAKHDGQTWRTLAGVPVSDIEWWRPQ